MDSQVVTSKVLKSVKNHLEKQAHSLNEDVQRVNQIQHWISLRKQKVKVLEESILDPEHTLEYTDILDSPTSSSSSSESEITYSHSSKLAKVLIRIEEEIAQIHKKIESQNKKQQAEENLKSYKTIFQPIEEANPNETFSSTLQSISSKWQRYFKQTEKRRKILQNKINAFQNQLDNWITERDHKRDLFLKHGHWLLSLRNELR